MGKLRSLASQVLLVQIALTSLAVVVGTAIAFAIISARSVTAYEQRALSIGYAVAETPDVVERMRLLVYHHVKLHGERAEEVFVGNSELRSLNRTQRSRIVALRHEYEQMFQNELEDGIRQGKFLPVDVQVTAYGILAMTTWVSSWYSSRGRLSLEEIAEIYTSQVLRGIWNPDAGKLESHLRKVGQGAKQPVEV
jgi:hypothetical protein